MHHHTGRPTLPGLLPGLLGGLAIVAAGAGCAGPQGHGGGAPSRAAPGHTGHTASMSAGGMGDSPTHPPDAGLLDPRVPLTPSQQRWVESTFDHLTPRQRIAQLVMVWLLADYSAADDPAFAAVVDLVSGEQVGGIVVSLGSPGEVASKLNYLQRRARVPLLVGADLEPGLGRLEGGTFVPSLTSAGSATVLPNNMAMGATGSTALARRAGEVTGLEALATGIRLVFAPVVDVNDNPSNPVINVRSFGEDPIQVARLGTAFVEGLQDAGAAATLKHFPGHGDTDVDSHLALPVVRSDMQRLRRVELPPFASGIAAGASAVMTAHVALPAIGGSGAPATLRPEIMTALLRDSLGFEGLTVTDALDMQGIGRGYSNEEAVVLSLRAGTDILLMPADVPAAITAVERALADGSLSQERVDDAVRRVLEWKVRTGTVANPIVSLDAMRQVVGSAAHRALADSVATAAITLLRDRPAAVPLQPQGRVTVISYAGESDVTAGRAFAAELRKHLAGASIARVSPSTPPSVLAGLVPSSRAGDVLVVTTHVRTIEGEGRPAVEPAFAAWLDSVARTTTTVVVAHGNPYVIRQFPSVGSYVATYGRGNALERAAARALVGLAPVTGRSPVSLPGFFAIGDGLERPPRAR